MELRATALWMSGVGPDAEGRVEFTILLERAISGDVSAFEQIILRYERRVFSLAWRLLGRPEDAQDASQEVFLRAFRYLHRFDRRRPFEPWLMKMTVNVCHDLSRKRHAQPQGVINPDVLRAADVVLLDIEGLSTAEVAEILGSSEAVRSQISSARLKIKKAVKRGHV